MRNYQKNTEDRKTIVNRIGELTGEKLKYTMPGYTFKGHGFTVLRDGTLEADETADESVIAALIEEGLILPCEEAVTEPSAAAQEAENEEDAVTGGEPTEGAESKDCGLTISVPISGHTGASLRNLISMLFSRGRLISKATGGTFGCAEALADHLKDDTLCITAERLIQTVSDFEAENGKALTGLSFEDGKVSFSGFPATEDPDKITAFQQLVCQMNKLAKEQKRTLARTVDESNERYIFRIWLLRLGMAGDEFKSARKILLAPLSGNAAFKDAAMEQRWKEKQNAKRDALRAEKARQAEENTICEPDVTGEEAGSDAVSE